MAYCLRLRIEQELADEASGLLFELGAQGVEERQAGTEAELLVYAERVAELERFSARLAELFALSVAEIEPVDESWRVEWVNGLQPVELVSGLRLLPQAPPSDAAERDPAGLYLAPALAFGFGEHPTTLLLANWLVGALSRQAEQAWRVLDIGCGTGVLALVAARSGAVAAVGIDIESGAIEAARMNADNNGLSERTRFGTELSDVSPQQELFDVVVANIELGHLLSVAPLVAEQSRPGARVALTGILTSQVVETTQAYAQLGVHLTLEQTDGDWALLSGERRAP